MLGVYVNILFSNIYPVILASIYVPCRNQLLHGSCKIVIFLGFYHSVYNFQLAFFSKEELSFLAHLHRNALRECNFIQGHDPQQSLIILRLNMYHTWPMEAKLNSMFLCPLEKSFLRTSQRTNKCLAILEASRCLNDAQLEFTVGSIKKINQPENSPHL